MQAKLHNDELQPLYDSGDYRHVADRCQQKLVELQQSDSDNRKALADVLFDLSIAEAAMSNYAAAVEAIRQRLEIDTSLDGETAPICMCDRWDLGYYYLRSGRVAESEAVLQHAMKLLATVPEDEQWQLSWGLIGLARVHVARADYKQAERLLLQAAKERMLYFGWQRPEFAGVYDLLSQVYWKIGSRLAAVRALRKAMRIFETAGETESSHYQRMQVFLGMILDSPDEFSK